MKRRDLFKLFTAGLVAAQLPAPAAAQAPAQPRSGYFVYLEYEGELQPGDIVGYCASGRVKRCDSNDATVAGFVRSVHDRLAFVQIAGRYELRFAEALN